MMPLPAWQRTPVHKATRYYGCAKCGTRFATPHAVYAHLATQHPATTSQLRRRLQGVATVGTNGAGRVEATTRAHVDDQIRQPTLFDLDAA
jgi:hypothetical protein